jgi:hypothetical protein
MTRILTDKKEFFNGLNDLKFFRIVFYNDAGNHNCRNIKPWTSNLKHSSYLPATEKAMKQHDK